VSSASAGRGKGKKRKCKVVIPSGKGEVRGGENNREALQKERGEKKCTRSGQRAAPNRPASLIIEVTHGVFSRDPASLLSLRVDTV